MLSVAQVDRERCLSAPPTARAGRGCRRLVSEPSSLDSDMDSDLTPVSRIFTAVSGSEAVEL